MNSLLVHLTKLEKILIVAITILLLFVSSHFIMEHDLLKEQNQAPAFLDGLEPNPSNSKVQDSIVEASLDKTSNKTDLSTQATQAMSQTIVVDIKGAVTLPGIYKLENDARVIDAIEKAGGVTPEAELKQINLAQKLADEMVIYVPFIGEETTASSNFTNSGFVYNSSSTGSGVGQGKISINTATEAELSQLDGIGSVKAKAIVDYRTKHGGFKSLDELMNVSGIGEKTFDKIKEKIILH